MATVDVEILGGGVFGLAVAFACARRGAHVRVVEKRTLGAGCSGGIVGALAPHTPDEWNVKKQFQFESLVLSEAWWTDVSTAARMNSGFTRCGRLQPVQNERSLELARERQKQARIRWQSAATWKIVRESRFSHWKPETPTGWIVHDNLSALIDPVTAMECLAGAVRNLGCEIVEGKTESNGAAAQVWATGHEGLTRLGEELGTDVGAGEKGQALSLRFDARELSLIAGFGLHLVPHADGTIAVGSTSERYYSDSVPSVEKLDALLAGAVRLVPALEGAPVIARWAGIRPRSRSPLARSGRASPTGRCIRRQRGLQDRIWACSTCWRGYGRPCFEWRMPNTKRVSVARLIGLIHSILAKIFNIQGPRFCYRGERIEFEPSWDVFDSNHGVFGLG